MRKRYKNKISLKIFLITSLTFTTLLIGALFFQSYFYQLRYRVTQKSQFDIAYEKLSKELRRSDTSARTVAGILSKYQKQYGIWAAIFLDDKITEKYSREELEGYEYSEILEEGIEYYKETIGVLFRTSRRVNDTYSYSGNLESKSKKIYNLLALECFGNGQVLLIIGTKDKTNPAEFVDWYYVYISLIGAALSLLLSYLISRTVSKPLLKLNNAAARMAELDFSEKIKSVSSDELGQLSGSLNTMSEKLDATLKDLTAANARLALDIETRKEFVANVSHELRTPLAVLKGYAEALLDNIREDKKEHYIKRIVRETDDMSKLVQDMLDLSYIESGQYKLRIDEFDLTALTLNALDNMQLLIDEKKLRVNRDFPEKAVYLTADRIKIGQVITNFIHNAIRHTPAGGSLFVSVSNDASGVYFTIENEGENIAAEKLDKIWEPFYRGEEHRNKKTGGTGLGLAISATILKLHNLGCGVENTSRGVRFYFFTKGEKNRFD